jgi:hypothetical protein
MTRADIELATPRCQRTVVSGKTPRHGVHRPCWRLMTYDAPANTWRCTCGGVTHGHLVAALKAAA